MNRPSISGVLLALLVSGATHGLAATPESCRALQKHGKKAEAQSCFESLVRGARPTTARKAIRGLEQYDQANEQFPL